MKNKKRRGRPPGAKNYDDEFIETLADKMDKWVIKANKSENPADWWLGEFIVGQGLYEEIVSKFSERNEVFNKSLKKAKMVQQNRLVTLGLQKKIDTGMAIFALKNVAGWRDSKPEEKPVDNRLEDEFEFVGVPKQEDNGRFKRFLN